MSLFAKSINTKKADPLEEMKQAIGEALETAQKAGVTFGQILHAMRSHTAHLQRMHDSQIEARGRNPFPQQCDALTLKPIDAHRQAAPAEEEMAARELREQQAAYRQDVNRRDEAELRREGKIL